MRSDRNKNNQQDAEGFSYNDLFRSDLKKNFAENAGYYGSGDMFDEYICVNTEARNDETTVYDDYGEFDHNYTDEFNCSCESKENGSDEAEADESNEADESDEAEVNESDIYAQAESDAKDHYLQMSKEEKRKELTKFIGELDPNKQKKAELVKIALAKQYEKDGIDLFFPEELFLSNYIMIFMWGRYYIYNGMTYELLTQKTFMLCCKELLRATGNVYLKRLGLLKEAYAFTLVQREDKNEIMHRMRRYQNYIVFENCVVDAETMKVDEHSDEISVPGYIHAEYIEDGNLHTPQMDRFLYIMTAGDEEVIELIWDILGYCLLLNAPVMRVFFWFGTESGSGKSVLGSVIRELLGEDQTSSIEANKLGDRFGASRLIDSPVNIAMECSGDLSRKAVTKIKTITGDRIFDAEKKYENNQEIMNRSKLIFGSNEAISIANVKNEEAVFDRLVVVPTLGSCPKEERDVNFDQVLLQERNEIATKAVKHANKLIKNEFRFNIPTASIEMKKAWVENNMTDFEKFCANCIEKCDKYTFTPTQELHEAYKDFSGDSNMSIKQFGRRFKIQFPTMDKGRKDYPDGEKLYGYYGICLK